MTASLTDSFFSSSSDFFLSSCGTGSIMPHFRQRTVLPIWCFRTRIHAPHPHGMRTRSALSCRRRCFRRRVLSFSSCLAISSRLSASASTFPDEASALGFESLSAESVSDDSEDASDESSALSSSSVVSRGSSTVRAASVAASSAGAAG